MPTVDIVILNYNTQQLLQDFLPTVLKNSNFPGANVIIVDNCSSDNSAQFIKENYPQLRLIITDKNRGYAGGYNYALKQLSADYFVLLNSDALPLENWLNPLIEMAENNKNIAAIQPKLLDYKNPQKFEYAGAAGGVMDKFGFPFCKGRIFGNVEVDNKQYNIDSEIFWASGAAFFIRRSDWETANGLDEDFFAHMEEIDLCWRLKNMGRQIWYCSQSSVYHVGGATLSNINPKKTFLNFRNGLLCLHKNLHISERNSVIFKRKLLDVLAAIFFCMQFKFKHALQVFKAHQAFAKIKHNYSNENKQAKQLNELSGLIYTSIVFQYFFKRNKTFEDILNWLSKK